MRPYIRDIVAPVNAAPKHAAGTRCVLGVLALEMGEPHDYPVVQTGTRLLFSLGVPIELCEPIAEAIIAANDRRDFDRAWRLLDVAHRLVYREFRRRQRAARPKRPWLSWAAWAGEALPAASTPTPDLVTA